MAKHKKSQKRWPKLAAGAAILSTLLGASALSAAQANTPVPQPDCAANECTWNLKNAGDAYDWAPPSNATEVWVEAQSARVPWGEPTHIVARVNDPHWNLFISFTMSSVRVGIGSYNIIVANSDPALPFSYDAGMVSDFAAIPVIPSDLAYVHIRVVLDQPVAGGSTATPEPTTAPTTTPTPVPTPDPTIAPTTAPSPSATPSSTPPAEQPAPTATSVAVVPPASTPPPSDQPGQPEPGDLMPPQGSTVESIAAGTSPEEPAEAQARVQEQAPRQLPQEIPIVTQSALGQAVVSIPEKQPQPAFVEPSLATPSINRARPEHGEGNLSAYEVGAGAGAAAGVLATMGARGAYRRLRQRGAIRSRMRFS